MNCMPMGSGRPYPFADGTSNPVNHSFVSSDGDIWDPYTPQSSPTAVDFFPKRTSGVLLSDRPLVLEGCKGGFIYPQEEDGYAV
jgi:hypothetical protein